MAFNIPQVIEKNETGYPLTFEFLRAHGIDFLQQFSGNKWTDFNLHDPGVTILEQLCFALTDLSYRTNFSIEDILADKNGVINNENNSFFSKQEALNNQPVSINDFRKYLIDSIYGIKNAWLVEITSAYTNHYIRGLYNVIIQIDEDYYDGPDMGNFENEIKAQVRRSLAGVRNICTNFEDIIVLQRKEIQIDAEITVDGSKPAEETLAKIYYTIKTSINKPVRSFTQKELLDKGLKIEEIYEGPIQNKGIIPDSELGWHPTEIDPSQLAGEILLVPGVLVVKSIKLSLDGKTYVNETLGLNGYWYPFLNPENISRHIVLQQNKFKVFVPDEKFNHAYQKILQQSKRGYVESVHKNEQTTNLYGKYRDLEIYHSIQNYFPFIYGIGQEGPLAGETNETKAKGRQLKAYLMLFEQVLANYLSQLNNINGIYSPQINTETAQHAQTYFAQPLSNVPGAMDIINSFTSLYQNGGYGISEWNDFVNDTQNKYSNVIRGLVETDAIFQERKNAMLDHFLARFNLSLSGYAASLYDLHYNKNGAYSKVSTLLKWKSDILQNVTAIISNRVRGCNYIEPDSDVNQRSFERNIYTYLHIDNEIKRSLLQGVNNQRAKVTPSHKKDSGKETVIKNINGYNVEINNHAQELGLADGAKQPLVIGGQTVSFLKIGLDPNNYTIVQDENDPPGYLILFKHPENSNWKLIGNYSTKGEAEKALVSCLETVKKMSTRSEGFHLTEHTLLRPNLGSACFGFSYSIQGRLLFSNKNWLTFSERENLINGLLVCAKESKDKEALTKKLNSDVKINMNLPLHSKGKAASQPTPAAEIEEDIYRNLKAFSDKNEMGYQFKNVIKLSNGTLIDEEFYNFRMSFMFSSWPARFQDENFRTFAETLIGEYTPAYLQSAVYWLDIKDMQAFEAIYLPWYASLKDTEPTSVNSHAEKLTMFLAKHNYISHPI